MGGCGPDVQRVAATLGDRLDCAGAPPVVSVHSPLGLDNWTQPVLELVMILGALAALGHAVRWWRRSGDPTGVGLWAATIVQVLILEPPLYFPDRFGLQDRVGLIFVHNQFSVQFLYDRLPLYIVALYPALTYLAYALVRRTGVLDRENAVVGAACVAFVFHCLYEIFDGLGPQLHWWAWNPVAPTNSPWLASVPLTSAVMFAGASPFGLALGTRLLLARRAAAGPIPVGSLVLRVIAVGLSAILAMLVFAVPYGLLGEPGQHLTARSVVLWAELAGLAAVAIWALGRAWRRSATGSPVDGTGLPVDGTGSRIDGTGSRVDGTGSRVDGTGSRVDGAGATVVQLRKNTGELGGADRYPVVAATAYLVIFAGLWATALPAYLKAESGRTLSGAPTGNLGYVVLCTLLATGAIIVAGRHPAVHREASMSG